MNYRCKALKHWPAARRGGPAAVDLSADSGSCDAAKPPRGGPQRLYRQILDEIERNEYDVFRKRAYVPKWRKMMSLPVALLRAKVL